MKKTLLILSALLLGATPALAVPSTYLVDPDAPKTDPGPPPPSTEPPVYHPPVYYPPAPRPEPPVYYPPAPKPHSTSWYNVDLYIRGYGTTPIEFRTFSSGLKTIIAYGPGGKEKLKRVNCYTMDWKSVHNRNPYRFQHEVVKAVCRRY